MLKLNIIIKLWESLTYLLEVKQRENMTTPSALDMRAEWIILPGNKAHGEINMTRHDKDQSQVRHTFLSGSQWKI